MFTAYAKGKRALATGAGLAGLLAWVLIGCSHNQPAATSQGSAGQTGKSATEQTGSSQPGQEAAATPLSENPVGATTPAPQAVVEIKAVDAQGHEVTLDLKTIYFDFDKYDIRSDQQSAVDFNAAQLKKDSALHVIIEGHCDERGTTEYNLALGQRRAVAVMNALVGDAVGKDMLKTISYGKERPAMQGHSEMAWSKNRRSQFRTS